MRFEPPNPMRDAAFASLLFTLAVAASVLLRSAFALPILRTLERTLGK